ncbi:ABC transporter substrate-binding protein [Saccharibacillus sp. CPCC 101409]|uniref:ABC transporter substrate-binding protein n=1 Tax=Saccharibacillus sp. CPCC 101409 TaxID=3058041 RepID=UPI002670ECA4|nr:ABC transporter substrate-binding protein [Saccharibacillus sp. CPCC 101409]MDO3410971.1 ABC transporter substrate-binding protein [Saccharibacillus sp. CPCC 101409]
MIRRFRSTPAVWASLLLILLLSACSGTPAPASGTEADSAPPAESSDTTTEAAAFPRTVEAANGSVVVERKPERVAVVHWGCVDSILLFDLPSLGLTLPFTQSDSSLGSDTYKPYIDRVDELAIVGENTTVNLEALLAYKPDLIIAGSAINAEQLEQIEKIATTVVLDENQTDVWTDWPSVVTKFGEILGQEEIARQFIGSYQSRLAEARAQLADTAGSAAFLQVRADTAWLGGTKTLTPYYDKGLGLTPLDDPAAADGSELSLEGLAKLDPDYLFLGYFNYDNPDAASVTDEWEKTEVWKSLQAVKENRVYPLNGILAMGYGPLGHLYGIEAVTDALTR